jgi:hypothetical protein
VIGTAAEYTYIDGKIIRAEQARAYLRSDRTAPRVRRWKCRRGH